MTLPSESKDSLDARQWLQEKVYAPKVDRTVRLVKLSVDALQAAQQVVSIATIVAKSKELDPEGRGVSASAINRNAEANNYYRQYRSHKEPQRSRSKTILKQLPAEEFRIKPDRDLDQARQRYLKLTKEELVARLLGVEQALATQQEQWHQEQEDLLVQCLNLEAETDSSNPAGNKLDYLTMQVERLKAQNRELKAQQAGIESLEAEIQSLKKQNAHLMHLLQQATADERVKNAQKFAQALREAGQPAIPNIEF